MSLSICGRVLTRSFLRKRRDVCRAEMDSSRLERTYTLFDLLCVGIGGTVGSGVFVLTGLIAREYTGPGVVISWLIAGFGCCFSAMSYAELSCRIPSAGSSYAYVYVALGEFPAVIAAWCLSLEYGISGSAVARSWGDKVNAYIASIASTQFQSSTSNNGNITPTHTPTWNPFDPGYGINIFAGLLQIAVVIVLLAGIDIGKFAVNTFTVVKIVLVIFMIVSGLLLFQPSNISAGWAPMGVAGILRGATSCFFGFVGYDEVCCLAAEAKDPDRVLPLAVFGTITIVTVFYCLASLALVGMQDYTEINVNSGFSEALRSRGCFWSQNVVAIGEIVTLPLVVLVSFLAQPRLQYAMATDGLLPRLFSEVDRKGNLVKGIVVSGIICTVIAVFVPFKYLDDMISAGVLVSFNLTNASLIIIRRCDSSNPVPCTLSLILFNIFSILLHILLVNISFGSTLFTLSVQFSSVGILLLFLLLLTYFIYSKCPENEDLESVNQFRVPGLPFVPLFGIFVNYLLLAQLSTSGILLVFVYFGIAATFYFGYGIHHSKGNNTGWRELLTEATVDNGNIKYESVDDTDCNMLCGLGFGLRGYEVESTVHSRVSKSSDISHFNTSNGTNMNGNSGSNYINNNDGSSASSTIIGGDSNQKVKKSTGNLGVYSVIGVTNPISDEDSEDDKDKITPPNNRKSY